MNRYLVLCAAAIAGAFMMSGAAFAADPVCGLHNGKAATGDPIVIGAITGKTGPDDFSAATKSANAYFDCVNANGGINGRPIKYEIGDDQWNPEIAAQLAAKIVKDDGAVAMAGSASFVECGANADLYKTAGIVSIAGVGVPRECFSASNYAPTNAGPRVSTTAAAQYAGEVLGAKSFVCIAPNTPNVGPWACDGVKTWAESKGFKSESILIDPATLDAASVVLQAAGYSPDAIILSLPKGLMLPVLTAAEEQGLNDKIKFLSAASGYDLTVPATLGAAWNGKFWVNMEFNALGSEGADNQNWLAVMDAFAPKDAPRDTFSQAGYLAARVVTEAMLTIDPAKLDRAAVTAALGNVKSFKSDIFCADWYYGAGAPRQNANHATRMSITDAGVWKAVSECAPSADPELADILAYEAANGIGK